MKLVGYNDGDADCGGRKRMEVIAMRIAEIVADEIVVDGNHGNFNVVVAYWTGWLRRGWWWLIWISPVFVAGS